MTERGLEYQVRGDRWKEDSAVLECGDPALLDVFGAVATDVAERVAAAGGAVSWQDVRDALSRWESLLARTTRLSREQEVGLWGELRIIADAPGSDSAIEAWRGPEGAAVDFFAGGLGLEVKTGRSRLSHWVSQTQVNSPQGDFPVLLASQWVDEDPIDGRTLPELVDIVRASSSRPGGFEEKLLLAGYSDLDRADYSTRMLLLEAPLLFAEDSVPRVRSADEGVSNLRYRATLDEADAIDSGPERSLDGSYWNSRSGEHYDKRRECDSRKH